jgi:hypothetical protein
MDKRLLEVMSELLIEVQHLKKDTNKRFDSLEGRFDSLEGRFEKVEKQQININKGLSEVRLSVMKLSEKIPVVANHEKRIKRIEKIVLNKR